VKTPETSKDLYKKAGVDIETGDRLVDWLQENSDRKKFRAAEMIEGIGAFSGLVRPNFTGMKDPLLVASTDGVGTKLLLGLEADLLEGLGIDLVAMCVNDLYCVGARPMFFLDYYATGKLNEEQFKKILTGIKSGLSQAQCYLLGGETAELPGLYEKNHFDLAGFVVGVVDGAKKLGPHLVKTGDRLFALPSTGFHSNGYSLIRRWLTAKPASLEVVKKLLEPTKIYHELPELLDVVGTDVLHAVANITGGGISGNLPRVMPAATECHISQSRLPITDFARRFIADNGASHGDVETVFNLGAGMIVAIDKNQVDKFTAAAARLALGAVDIGSVETGKGESKVVYHE